jgi:hypothetical protein
MAVRAVVVAVAGRPVVGPPLDASTTALRPVITRTTTTLIGAEPAPAVRPVVAETATTVVAAVAGTPFAPARACRTRPRIVTGPWTLRGIAAGVALVATATRAAPTETLTPVTRTGLTTIATTCGATTCAAVATVVPTRPALISTITAATILPATGRTPLVSARAVRTATAGT